jgi:PhnB protein
MSNITLHPYLFFNGNCREAMEFYKSVFGGELTLQTMGEVPGDFPGKEENKDKIIHANLSAESFTLYGSDSTKASDAAAKVEITINGDDEERMREIFKKLSEGGEVVTELRKEFWGDTFGKFTDKYKIDWMMNILAKKA